MIFTKLEHSGCVVEANGKKVVCDPVEFEEKLPMLENVVAIVITHRHGDHFQPAKIEGIVAKNPDVRIFAPRDLAENEIARCAVEKVEAGVEWNLSGFNLKFFGRDHAPIVPGVVPCANVGVVINDRIVNPGDSFDLPDSLVDPELLLVPSAAPWCKVAEGMEYIKSSRPKITVPVHDAVLSKLGNRFNNNWLNTACEEIGAEFVTLKTGEVRELA